MPCLLMLREGDDLPDVPVQKAICGEVGVSRSPEHFGAEDGTCDVAPITGQSRTEELVEVLIDHQPDTEPSQFRTEVLGAFWRDVFKTPGNRVQERKGKGVLREGPAFR